MKQGAGLSMRIVRGAGIPMRPFDTHRLGCRPVLNGRNPWILEGQASTRPQALRPKGESLSEKRHASAMQRRAFTYPELIGPPRPSMKTDRARGRPSRRRRGPLVSLQGAPTSTPTRKTSLLRHGGISGELAACTGDAPPSVRYTLGRRRRWFIPSGFVES